MPSFLYAFDWHCTILDVFKPRIWNDGLKWCNSNYNTTFPTESLFFIYFLPPFPALHFQTFPFCFHFVSKISKQMPHYSFSLGRSQTRPLAIRRIIKRLISLRAESKAQGKGQVKWNELKPSVLSDLLFSSKDVEHFYKLFSFFSPWV